MSTQPIARQIPLRDETAESLQARLPPQKPAQVNGKFYVRLVSGLFQHLRRLVSWPLLAAFFGTVWLQWNDRPMVLFSFNDHRIFLFGLNLSWYDLPLLAGLLIAGAALLFFMAVAMGRVWCGFACPQSVWTWWFIRIEQLIEGDARKLRKMDEKGLTAVQWGRRVLKHLVWLLVGFATAITFTGYFVPIRDLLVELAQFNIVSASWAWVITMGLLTWANAGLVREKICLHACPYSRFQSVMFDSDTRTVSYDIARGEPRRGPKDSASGVSAGNTSSCSSQGDCVDCSLCVQVCPVGIDIRNGLQLACIDCGACIDACDGVMAKIGKAAGLIRFASENQLLGKRSPWVRPRLLTYAAVLTVMMALVGFGFANTHQLLLEVSRDRGALYVERPDNTVCNDFDFKLESFVEGAFDVQLAVQGLSYLQSGWAGFELVGPDTIDLRDNQGMRQNFRICALKEDQGTDTVRITARMGDVVETRDVKFITPVNP
ncbi:cytochrome c oxidase accessory protein CcoG [Parathalassolituus penaei]|uniref:Cytochrome c oxidase accessory protein CcoG n=1 Tax=Parathalassolituus penaei TaxID=2997323 RepID=A0A9X3ELL9_9GAMM|nr:cytochrome c oxidase accessory protein CcoG [Parathalassolituus penaei]MCY0966616.1 cytochrome c oxidase accessory protein CcoG [Parathalassolituus penaei]